MENMIYTHESLDSAKEAIPDFCKRYEQDIFVYHVKYQFGEEFSLRTRDQVMNEDSPCIVHKFFLPITHHFSDRDNVLREADVWQDRLDKNITIDRHCCTEKGYKVFSHYTLKT